MWFGLRMRCGMPSTIFGLSPRILAATLVIDVQNTAVSRPVTRGNSTRLAREVAREAPSTIVVQQANTHLIQYVLQRLRDSSQGTRAGQGKDRGPAWVSCIASAVLTLTRR